MLRPTWLEIFRWRLSFCSDNRSGESLMRRLSLILWSGWTLSPLLGQTDWPVYGHDPGGMRYSPLKQVTEKNVAKLRVAWTYDSVAPLPDTRADSGASGSGRGAAPGRGAATHPRLSEATPLVVGDVMYLGTRLVKIFMRRDCSIGVGRRGVLDSGCHVADGAQAEKGRERAERCSCLGGCVLRDNALGTG
jgi:hypothetical protein